MANKDYYNGQAQQGYPQQGYPQQGQYYPPQGGPPPGQGYYPQQPQQAYQGYNGQPGYQPQPQPQTVYVSLIRGGFPPAANSPRRNRAITAAQPAWGVSVCAAVRRRVHDLDDDGMILFISPWAVADLVEICPT
ncbi:hypothetical protein BV25DRAFT_1900712 [Artomyces pyxidatus]|uniref:Uncharacterized protein n=1 Tax=Artomyces pyxidatus TaxID=48021 RepID=A0ACB8SYZ2_9AGAM|nr:hypothetical protein BV25DRAFT_1900712 [Artomyces pyxidatus]